jgi:vacuolar-type H+-ATPase catalytic subunit A/Vma1
MNVEKGKEIIEKISTYETDVEKLSQMALSYKVNYDVTNNITSMYDEIISSINKCLKKEYSFTLNFSKVESNLFSSDVKSILRQTANVKDNEASNSISNLYNINNKYKHLTIVNEEKEIPNKQDKNFAMNKENRSNSPDNETSAKKGN